MKNILLVVSFFVLSIFFYAIPDTNSYFASSIKSEENIFETDILLDFYPRSDNHAVGFEVKGISQFDSLVYTVSYTHDGLNEVIQSTIPLSGQNSFKEEWMVLGSCSSGGTWVYYDVTSPVKLSVELLKGAATDKVLTSTLTF